MCERIGVSGPQGDGWKRNLQAVSRHTNPRSTAVPPAPLIASRFAAHCKSLEIWGALAKIHGRGWGDDVGRVQWVGRDLLRVPAAQSRRRPLVDADQSPSPPPMFREPGPGSGDRRVLDVAVRRKTRWVRVRRRPCPRNVPSVEPAGRRTKVEPARARAMLAPVGEHIDEAVPHFARRSHRPRMITVTPDASAPPKNAIDCARQTNRELRQTTRKSALVRAFHDEMDVVDLHREMRDAKALARSARESTTHFREHRLPAQAR